MSIQMDVGAFLNVNLSKTQEAMYINKIIIPEEMFADLLIGKRPAGTIGYDPTTNVIDFKPFKKNQKRRRHAKLLAKLPWGWVKESKEKQKHFTSFSKHLPLEEKLQILDQDNELAKRTLIERELELIEFC